MTSWMSSFSMSPRCINTDYFYICNEAGMAMRMIYAVGFFLYLTANQSMAWTIDTDDSRLLNEGSGRVYDSSGRYQGKLEDSGKLYDSSGRLEGRIDANGRIYDAQGRYQGRIDHSQRDSGRKHYDSQGRFLGREDASGRLYDAQGRYQGRIDSKGRRYDSQGRFVDQMR